MNREELLNKLSAELSQEDYDTSIKLSEIKFLDKENLKLKYLRSILDGYIDPGVEWLEFNTYNKYEKSFIDKIISRIKNGEKLSEMKDVDLENPVIKSALLKYKLKND
jgi:hypothetical protein